MNATMIFAALAVVAVLSLALWATDGQGAPRAARSPQPDKTIVFKQAPDHAGKQQDLTLHVFLPEGWKAEDKRPAIVFWFGGGFVGGSAGQFYPQAEYLAGRGLVAVSADYRVKMGKAVAVQDGRSAMRYVRSHAAELGIDPAKLIGGGGSAGGYVAVAMGSGAGSDDKADDASVPFKPAALVLFNPAVQPPRGKADAGPDSDKGYILPGPITADFPPAVCFYGTKDVQFLGGGRVLRDRGGRPVRAVAGRGPGPRLLQPLPVEGGDDRAR